MADVEHLPQRPSWECRACGDPWPCLPAKVEIEVEHAKDPTPVGIRLHRMYRLAAWDADLPDAGDDALYARIVGWLPGGQP